jgi:A/G-specific adenine glycosylase
MPGSGDFRMTTKQREAGLAGAQPVIDLQRRLLAWYRASRRDLPWRRTRDAYAIWVSEIMLQQTRTETVLPYYSRFLSRFPDVSALAEAPIDDVLAVWSGLGYYRRARLLHAGARAVVGAGGALPRGRDALLGIPGVGRYTAGAVASIAFGEPVGLVDGNVARVLARLFAIEEDMRGRGMRRAESLADRIVAREDPGAWNQALMELGATVCTPRTPSCPSCPVESLCRARLEGREATLPVLGAKAKPKAIRVQAIVATSEERVLLGRRSPGGLFGGLWEPPSAEGPARVRAALVAALPAQNLMRAGAVIHVLSHRRLTVDVLRGDLEGEVSAFDPPAGYDALRAVPCDALERIGVSTLARKVLAAAGVGRRA